MTSRQADIVIKREYKDVPVFIQNIDTVLGQVEAIVSVMGVIDMMDDVIHPGSYVKTITERAGKIRVLDNHRTDSADAAIGRPINIRELKRGELPAELLAEYPEATGGLWTLSQFDLDTPAAASIFKKIKSNTLNEWSIGFDVLDWDKSYIPDPANPGKKILVRNIRSIRLWEYSVVLWGANQATATIGAKTAPLPSEIESETDMRTKSQADAPNYQEAPAGHDRCSTCWFFDPAHQCLKYDFVADPDSICDSYKAGGNQKGAPKPDEKRGVDGVPETMGADMVARVYDTYIAKVNAWLSCYNITLPEHRNLVDAGTGLVDFLTSTIPPEIAGREIDDDDFMGMMFWAAEGAEILKRVSKLPEAKAGRVLSSANATKLVDAVNTITDVLKAAGVYDQADEAEADTSMETDEEKAKKGAQPQAGSQPAPTLSETELAKALKAGRQNLIELKEKLK